MQDDGQGPSCDLFSAGQGMSCVEFRIGSPSPTTVSTRRRTVFYQLPSVITPRITRNFSFDRDNGQWVINGRFANCNELRFAVTQNSAENWLLINPRSDWQHPIHIHLEQHQIISRSNNGGRRHSYSHHSRSAGPGAPAWGSGSHGDCAFGGGGGGISTSRPNVPNVEVSRKDVTRLQGQ